MIHDLVVSLLLVIGSLLMLFASIGLVRFSGALCRSHALAKATTFGICTMLIALWIGLADDVSGLKVFLVICFSILTIPLASHLIALLVYEVQKPFDEKQPPEKE